MKAAMLTALRQIALRDVPPPTITRSDQVLIRVDAVGVCGSDVHYYNEGCIGSQVVEYPWTIGHECAGTVLQAGSGVTRLREGQRVVVDPLIVCGACDQCRAGRENTCRNQQFLGNPRQASGAMAQLLVMPDYTCVPMADHVSAVEGALCEPLAIGVYAAKMSALRAGQSAAILGSGPIGLSVLLALRAQAGAGLGVCATDLLDYRVQAARSMGADHAANAAPGEAETVAWVRGLSPGGVDAVFECAGKPETVNQGLAMLRPGGTIYLIGIPESKTLTIHFDLARREELTLQPVRRQNRCAERTVELVNEGRIDVRPLATHVFPLAEAQKAIETARTYSDGVIKALIEPWK